MTRAAPGPWPARRIAAARAADKDRSITASLRRSHAATAATPDQVGSRQHRPPTQRATQWVLFGSLASGLGAYVFQVLGSRALGPQAFKPVTVLWTIQYLASTTALYSAEAYVTRTATLHPGEPEVLDRPVRMIGVWVAVVATVTGVATWALRDSLFGGAGDLGVVAALLIVSYGAFFVIRGRMAGAGRFRSYGAATALESIGRIVIAAPVLLVAAGTRSLAWVMPLGPALVACWWLYDRRRTLPGEPEVMDLGEGMSTARRFLVATTTANAVSQTLLAAGPLVLLPLGAADTEVSVFFLTVTAARVPLVFALGGLLSRVLPPLTRMARDGREAGLRRVAVLGAPAAAGIAALGALAAWLAGPELLSLFFGAAARPDRLFVTMTAGGVLLATGSLLMNQVLIARGSEQRMVLPWLAALGVAVTAVLVGTGTPTLRVSTAFVAGEVTALAGLVIAVLTAPPLGVPEP